MVNIFGDSGDSGERGPPGPAGVRGGIKDVIRWFPDMICEQIRKNVNALTFLIESIPPAKESDDVELSSDKAVKKWKAFNDRENKVLAPVNQEKGGELKKIDNASSVVLTRYGLVLNKKHENMYYMKNCMKMFLSQNRNTVALTMTFSVGVEDDDKIDPEEEFIISDYRWTKHDKSGDKYRGVSIIPRPNEKFDLYLHGALGEDGKNTLKIGNNLEKYVFHTLQAVWSASSGFYLLYKNGKALIDKTSFQHNTLPVEMRPGFYLGGFNAATGGGAAIVKSKCFTGVVSNLEIINTINPSIPSELLRFIVKKQTIHSIWFRAEDQLMEAYYNNIEEEQEQEQEQEQEEENDTTKDDVADSPILKRRKVT